MTDGLSSVNLTLICSYLQVKTNFRNAITIPEKSWSRFRDIFSEYVDKMKEAEKSGGTTGGGGGGSGGQSSTSQGGDAPPTSTSTATASSERDPPK